MNRNARMLMRSGGIAFAIGLVVSMVLGYSGNSQLASVGNTLFLCAIVVALVLVVAGVVIWLSTRGSEARTRDHAS